MTSMTDITDITDSTDPARPRYVTRDSEQAFAPPYRQAGCALYAFAIPAERARLQRVVDRFLAAPSGGRLRPRVAAGHVLLYFCDFAQSQSHDPDDARRGWLGERECGLWIPLRIEGSASPAFFTHAMFVDSGPAMCSGREVLGFPKEIGLLHVPRDPARASSLTLDALVMGDARTRPGSWRPLIELERLEASAASPAEGLRAAALRWADVLGVDGPRALAWLGRGRADFYNLKQFRDCADPTRACYQQVVRASAALRGARRVAPAGEYAYRVHPHPSHPLSEALGLPAEGRARGVFCDLDLDFEMGAVL
jgi:hypothetical protein